MTAHSESRIVPYPADLMFAIVADVERYPEFVPWVTALRIKKRDGDVLIAETVVGFKTLRERYTSRVVLDRLHWRIDVTQTEGVFRVLENHWHFTPQDDKSCRVDFAIKFEFKNRMLGAIAGSAFGLVVTQMTRAFEERARKLSQKSL
ncbi:MAG TPA: type II toxin-antitoxin system RatA family toxin [Rhizomicrobium sp.]|nr:type II toxin-antitoxin system RatA family toxin [Rhizomicrobium sp.]